MAFAEVALWTLLAITAAGLIFVLTAFAMLILRSADEVRKIWHDTRALHKEVREIDRELRRDLLKAQDDVAGIKEKVGPMSVTLQKLERLGELQVRDADPSKPMPKEDETAQLAWLASKHRITGLNDIEEAYLRLLMASEGEDLKNLDLDELIETATAIAGLAPVVEAFVKSAKRAVDKAKLEPRRFPKSDESGVADVPERP